METIDGLALIINISWHERLIAAYERSAGRSMPPDEEQASASSCCQLVGLIRLPMSPPFRTLGMNAKDQGMWEPVPQPLKYRRVAESGNIKGT